MMLTHALLPLLLSASLIAADMPRLIVLTDISPELTAYRRAVVSIP